MTLRIAEWCYRLVTSWLEHEDHRSERVWGGGGWLK